MATDYPTAPQPPSWQQGTISNLVRMVCTGAFEARYIGAVLGPADSWKAALRSHVPWTRTGWRAAVLSMPSTPASQAGLSWSSTPRELRSKTQPSTRILPHCCTRVRGASPKKNFRAKITVRAEARRRLLRPDRTGSRRSVLAGKQRWLVGLTPPRWWRRLRPTSTSLTGGSGNVRSRPI